MRKERTRKEEIISKGAYTAPQFGDLISVRQFILLREKGEKHLLLRLRNDRAERADAVSFAVKQFDVKGNLIGTETVTERSIAAEGGQEFAPQTPVVLHHACVDFTVEMISAEYGDYTYRLHGDKLTSSYENRAANPPVDKEVMAKKMRGKSSHVTARTLNAPALLVASMAIILLVVGVFAFLQLKNFMATEELFTLDSVEYRFLTDDRESGPISIVGYRGKAGNVIIPAAVEGHEVAEIADGAFAGKPLRSVTVKGSPAIGQRAFADCEHLDRVEIPHVTEIGNGAFANCRKLQDLTLNAGLTAIPASAFEGCRSLTEIRLPVGLLSLGDAAFRGCSALTDVTLPDTLADMGAEVFADCESLTSLTAPYAGANEIGKDNIGYFFGGSDRIPHSLAGITITKAEAIGDNAFAGCNGVVSVSLPDSVKSIGYRAFAGCVGLTGVRLPAGLTQLGIGAFCDCTALRSVVIPAGVRILSEGVFANCVSLQTVSLPSQLERIESDALMNCISLTRLDIPASVNSIQANALLGCMELEELTLPFLGEAVDTPRPLSDLFGAAPLGLKTLTVRQTTVIADYAFSGFEGLTKVTLQGDAASVGERAFERCVSLQSVTLPDTVTEMGAYAFADCAALSSVTLPAQLTSISEGMFSGCTSLQSIAAPAGVQTVGSRAFAGCSSLKDTPWLCDVTAMGEYVFDACTALEAIILPTASDRIENGTFNGCTSLRTVTMSPSTAVIGERAFAGCSALDALTIPGKTREILTEAFADCSSLTKISLPLSLQILGGSAFENCVSLTELTIPVGVTEIGAAPAAGCKALESLTTPFIGGNRDVAERLSYLTGTPIPKSLQRVQVTNAAALADSAFEGCTGLQTILLPKGLLTVGHKAFRDCTSLDSLILPDTVTRIGSYAFSGCRGLKEILIPDSVTALESGIFDGCTALTDITVPFIGDNRQTARPLSYLFTVDDIPASLSSVTLTNAAKLSANAFDGCRQLKTVQLNEGLQTVGVRAFRDCTALKTLTIPSTVTSIGSYAFEGCTGLKTLAIPPSVTSIGASAMARCTGLKEVEIPFVGTSRSDSSTFEKLFGDSYSIPHSLTKVTVTASETVKDNAFRGCTQLTDIVYACDVTAIGIGAFEECTSLVAFTVPETVAIIGDRAFRNCYALQKITVPYGVQSVGTEAFAGCGELTEITLPETVTLVGRDALRDCNALTEITLPYAGRNRSEVNGLIYLFSYFPSSLKKVTITVSSQISANAFAGMGQLEEVVYLQDITSIGSGAFYDCYSLCRFPLPETLTVIGSEAFYNCDSLTELVLPDGIVSIGERAFLDCNNLTSVTVGSRATYIGQNAFGQCYNLAELTVPFVGGTPTDGNGLSYWFGEQWNMPQSLKKITVTNSTAVKPSAFQYLPYVEEIIYTQDVTEVGNYAFQSCTALKRVELGDAIETIGTYSFSECNSLKSFTIPATCRQVGAYAFAWCYSLYEVYNRSDLVFEIWDQTNLRSYCLAYRADSAEVKKVSVDGVTLLLADDGIWYVVDYTGNSETLVLPSFFTADGTLVDSYAIAPYALRRRADLRSVIIPAAVTSIGNEAFWECTNLREVYNLSALPITRGSYDNGCVAYYAYVVHTSADAEPLTEVRIGDYGFLKSGDSWFLYRYYGTGGDITLGTFTYRGETVSSYEVLGTAFANRYDITSLVITDAVKGIERSAFQSMGSLRYVRIEENTALTVIPEYAFAWCNQLQQVVLPSTLTEIMYDAFWDCPSLREIYNLSPLKLTIGGDDHGYVAKYAFIIHDSLDDPALSEVRIGDYIFLNSGDVWLLERYEGKESDINLGAFTHKGKTVSSYSILSQAFRSNSYIERVVIGNEVKSIGREAFYNCSKLKSVSFADNTSVTEIPSYAFAYNYNLDSVILPASLTRIDSDAFWDCTNLLVVYNLSSLRLTLGSYDHGCVAAYARVIFTSPDEIGPEILNVERGGYTYKFIREGDVWNLYTRIQHGEYEWIYVLPELILNGVVTPYDVTAQISGYSAILIPASVTYVNWDTFSGNEIFYGGTAKEFAALTEGFNVAHYTVRYYADCVHAEDQWSYSTDGSIMTGMSYGYTVIKDATCTEKGIGQYTCSYCQRTWEEETAYFADHDLDGNGVCRTCGARFESRPLQDVWQVTNDKRYPFDITENGEIVSTNKGNGQTATITLTALRETVFSYDFYVSTENGCDMLIVRKNGVELTRESGTGAGVRRGITVDVAAGDTITVTYSKDGSVSTGEDLVKVLNLVYFVEEAGDTFER